ncbi:MAG: hypothetical protein ACFFD4_02365 [Candidatus Odinarchaeota archaeon]
MPKESKQVLVTVSGEDLEKHEQNKKWLEQDRIILKEAEYFRLYCRVYFSIAQLEKGPRDAIGDAALREVGFKRIIEKLKEYKGEEDILSNKIDDLFEKYPDIAALFDNDKEDFIEKAIDRYLIHYENQKEAGADFSRFKPDKQKEKE